ncbi:MAG: pyridoxal-5'-phosphate-dependent protein subunit beta [Chloroflexi bacterium]|nr:pyridoxal-5'-phosphate-dependent protein subunit beta [Chloroflexota bacterium]MCH2303932.1 pyridoxal-phosphate dependent enzyme [SAR202 cluster bacterium]|tara:strand:- start:73744 stop:74706 length:963 start_codon:yes stop_codon:yes gene_type:complete
MLSYKPIALDEIINARDRIKDIIVRTPLVKLNFDNQDLDIYIKLENLQPVGSFKLRGAANAMSLVSDSDIHKGVWTVSAGNMAQGLAWCAKERGIACTVIVPDQIPETKAANITRLGAKYIKVPFEKFEETFITRSYPGVNGHFIHPFSDPSVMAGNGTIGLEILEDLPDVQSLIISYAGGGLSCGIASAVKAINPSIKIYAAEVETGAPFAASLELGQPKVVNYTSSFVDGIGGSMVFNEMFDLAKELLDGSFVSSLEEIAFASKIIMERNRVIAEGAAAAAVAAAMAGKAGKGKTACIISGGNIDSEKIKQILSGKTP